MSVFNQHNLDYRAEPLFFGKQLNSQRYDVAKYPIFNRLTDRQLSFFWRPDEFSMSTDAADFPKLSQVQQNVFTENLSYQILLDSIQSRGVAEVILPICSQPELESAVMAWEFMEMIHSKSYSHIIQNVYADPSKVFDDILSNEAILARLGSVTENYDLLAEFNDNLERDDEGRGVPTYEHKKRLYLTLVDIHILEGIRFQVSFAVTFAYGQNKTMMGSSQIVQLIARDEALHMAMSQHLFNSLPYENDPDWARIADECKDEVAGMFARAIQEEKDWANYLFRNGSILGLNEDILIKYMSYIGDRRLRAFGQPIQFNESRNPIPWVEQWTNSRKLQVASQETEPVSYTVGGIDTNVEDSDFESLF